MAGQGEDIDGFERTRNRLAWALVALFTSVVVFSVAAVGLGRDPGPLTAILQLVLPSIVALMAMVLRFYFAERPARRRHPQNDEGPPRRTAHRVKL